MDQRVIAIIASWQANFVNYDEINKKFVSPGKVLHQAINFLYSPV